MLRDLFRNCRGRSVKYVTSLYALVNIVIKVDRLGDELMEEQDKFKSVSEELEQAFAEMSGY